MLVELKFTGFAKNVNYSFLEKMVREAKHIYFNYPEVALEQSFEYIMHVWHTNTDVDLVINTDKLLIRSKMIANAFINLGRANDKVELLFFFDSTDLKEGSVISDFSYLRNWATEFGDTNGFTYFICRAENHIADNYYFDSSGEGTIVEFQ